MHPIERQAFVLLTEWDVPLRGCAAISVSKLDIVQYLKTMWMLAIRNSSEHKNDVLLKGVEDSKLSDFVVIRFDFELVLDDLYGHSCAFAALIGNA